MAIVYRRNQLSPQININDAAPLHVSHRIIFSIEFATDLNALDSIRYANQLRWMSMNSGDF
jgi:hypothetical protein